MKSIRKAIKGLKRSLGKKLQHTNNSRINLEKSSPQLTFNFKDVMLGVPSIAEICASGQPVIAMLALATTIVNSLDIKPDSVTGVAYTLVFEAIIEGINELFEDHYSLLQVNFDNIKGSDLDEKVSFILDSADDEIGYQLFENPKSLNVVEAMRTHLIGWLGKSYLKPEEATILGDKFKGYFVEALFRVWVGGYNAPKRKEGLEKLKEAYENNPYGTLYNKELAWKLYHSKLATELDKPVFGETFSLRTTYIPLRAAKEKLSSNRSTSESYEIVNAHDELRTWLGETHASIRVISGGPGSGKSSLAKVFAIEAIDLAYRVFYVRLHFLHIESGIDEALNKYASGQTPIKKFDPFSYQERPDKYLLIFDGLDELSLTSDDAEKNVTELINQVLEKIQGNDRNLKILLLGRTQVVQEQQARVIRSSGPVLELLPYYLAIKDCERYLQYNEQNPPTDQRNEWWNKYGRIKGYDYDGLPENLRLPNDHELTELTSQPLLNYLVAQQYSTDPDNFDPSQNQNRLFEHLILKTWRREWGSVSHVQGMTKEAYFQTLEYIATTAWHSGNNRIARMKDITNLLPENLKSALTKLGGDDTKGLNRLLIAFYTRPEESASEKLDDRTFELTHKTFGEYLTARRILGTFTSIDRQKRDESSEKPSSSLLIEWVQICGPTYIDIYLKKFLLNEIRLLYSHEPTTVQKMQETCVELLKHVILHHMPVDALSTPDPLRYTEMLNYDRNAQEALLTFHSCCALVTNQVSDIGIASKKLTSSAAKWLHFLETQIEGYASYKSSLNHLLITNADLRGVVLFKANLLKSDLSNSTLQGAYLEGANFSEANMERANLNVTYLHETDFSNATLADANLNGTFLVGAIFSGANLNKVRMSGIFDGKVDAFGVQFNQADLSGANMAGANLAEASFIEANLTGATLQGASLDGANLKGSNLTNANLKDASLASANMSESIGITKEQLLETRTLYNAIIDPDLKKELEIEMPELFNKPQ